MATHYINRSTIPIQIKKLSVQKLDYTTSLSLLQTFHQTHFSTLSTENQTFGTELQAQLQLAIDAKFSSEPVKKVKKEKRPMSDLESTVHATLDLEGSAKKKQKKEAKETKESKDKKTKKEKKTKKGSKAE